MALAFCTATRASPSAIYQHQDNEEEKEHATPRPQPWPPTSSANIRQLCDDVHEKEETGN